MKLFSRQLMHKHQYLQHLTKVLIESEDEVDVTKLLNESTQELDSFIDFDMFLSIAGVSAHTTKVLY